MRAANGSRIDPSGPVQLSGIITRSSGGGYSNSRVLQRLPLNSLDRTF